MPDPASDPTLFFDGADAHSTLTAWLVAIVSVLLWLGFWNGVLKLMPRRLKDRLLVGLGVDATLAVFTIGPFIPGFAVAAVRHAGWAVLLFGPLSAMVLYTFFWCVLDEMIRGEPGGFHIRKYWIRRDGWVRYLAGWLCFAAAPMFWQIRVSEIVLYPPLRWAWGFPHLRARDYIAFSRHKTRGLVGADYLYCLYCEWMTGVWSLGTEMLRHLESMWCPLRFNGREDQCERCSWTFPDIRQWASPEGGMPAVEQFLKLHYEGRPLGERSHLGARNDSDKMVGRASRPSSAPPNAE